MCAAFLYFYPRMATGKPCFSGLTDETIRELAAIPDKVHLTLNLPDYLAQKQDWNQTVLDKSTQIMLKAKQRIECYWVKTDDDIELSELIGYPEVKQLYEPKEKLCLLSESLNTIDSHLMIVAIIAFIAITISFAIVFVSIYYRRRTPENHNRLV